MPPYDSPHNLWFLAPTQFPVVFLLVSVNFPTVLNYVAYAHEGYALSAKLDFGSYLRTAKYSPATTRPRSTPQTGGGDGGCRTRPPQRPLRRLLLLPGPPGGQRLHALRAGIHPRVRDLSHGQSSQRPDHCATPSDAPCRAVRCSLLWPMSVVIASIGTQNV